MSKSTPNKDMIGKGLRSLLQNIDAEFKNPAGRVEAATKAKAVATNRIPLSCMISFNLSRLQCCLMGNIN